MSAAFQLHPQLEADSWPVARLGLSQLRLMRDATYPWLLLVPTRPDLAELIDLDPADRYRLMDEIAAVSAALRAVTSCHKLNVATLGNMVRQLHVHVIARFQADPAWPGPVWGRAPATPYAPGAAEALIERLGAALG